MKSTCSGIGSGPIPIPMKSAACATLRPMLECASPYGTIRKPGVSGPNPSWYWTSVENDTMVIVRP